jgi:predicted nuclease with TOPRIM domain
MVDRVYIGDLPRLRKALEELREGFSELDSSKTNWIKQRIELLSRHAESLEELLNSREFSRELSHLRNGVVLLHSDLVYLRDNVKGMRKILQSEKDRGRKMN